MTEIKKIVLTGGPCAGKTTALVKIIEHFSSLGFKVFTIPEVPTMFTQADMDYLTKNKDFFYEGEKATLEEQIGLENKFYRMAQTCKEPVIIVCDRGTMDISAYMSPEMWDSITKAVGTSTSELRSRYDAVFHLVSAADGAEQYYTLSTNAQRLEKPDAQGLAIARDLDKKVINAWSGHPHHRIINNHDDFNKKIQRVIYEISAVLGLPQPIENEGKYLVELTGEIPDCIESEITQTYLSADPGVEVRLRRRTWNGKTVIIHHTRTRISATEQIETERPISNNLYRSLMKQADPYRTTIRKNRKSFVWKGQSFELDTYKEPCRGLQILECKGVPSLPEDKFPPFIHVVKDITGNKDYYNYNMALKKPV